VDDAGNRVKAPLSESQAGVDAFSAGFTVFLGTVVTVVGAMTGLRVLLENHRRRQWSRELDRIVDGGGRNPNIA
jgi:hypothetical protein